MITAHDIVNALDTHVFKFTPTHTTNPILTVVDKVFISFENFKHDDQVRIAKQVYDILKAEFNHICDVVKYNTEFVVQTDVSRFDVMMATDQFKFRWEDIMLHVDDGRSMWFSDGQGRIKNIGVATDHQPCIPWLKEKIL